MKPKLMNMAAMALSALLCLTTTGAWAAPETPLITIESTGENASFKSGSKTFDDKVTVTFSGGVGNDNDNWGWYTYSESGITLTVTAAEGYTITGVKFYNNSGSAFDASAPFEAILVYDSGVVTKVNGTSIGQLGVTKIEVYGYAGTPATVDVTGVTLAPTTATLTLGETETVTLTPTVLPDDATYKSVTWSSSSEAVATVSNEGVVTAVAAGEATITVTTTDGAKTATCTVTVTAPAAPAPAWLLDGDEWDEATKTLTVKSNTANEAYKGQTVIEHVIISSGVTSVGNSAFQGCSGLTSVTIGNSVTSIGNYAFRSCSSLTSITIPNSVTSIGVTAFGGCTGLTSMVVASENTKYDSRDCNAIIETSSNTLIAGCKNTAIPNSVTSIGESAFYECSDLTSITIPNSVTSIGDRAFSQCTGLTSVTIGNSVTSIGVAAFADCSSLTSITIPNSVTSIGADAFIFCENITDVFCYADPNNLTWDDGYCNDFKYDDHATVCHVMASALATYEANWGGTFFDDDNTGVNVTFVGDLPAPAPAWLLDGDAWDDATKTLTVNSDLPVNAYKGQTVIEHVIISSGVTSVGNSAFEGCSGLTSMTIDATTPPTLGSGAFDGTAAALKIYVPAGSVDTYKAAWAAYENKIEPIVVERVQIGDLYYNLKNDNKTAEVTYQKFMSETNYSSLTAVNIPESVEYNSVTYSVTSIGMGAFLGCTGLTSITIPSSVTSIGDGAFQSCEGLTSIEIPNSVTSIGDAAFYGCTGLTSVIIGNSVTSIGYVAFAYCSGLTSITIPNSVTSIGESAFSGCSDLTSVTIGNSVTSIGDYAFAECSGLETVTINAESLESYGTDAFEGTAAALKIYVPAGSVDTYKAAWSAYEDKIEAIVVERVQIGDLYYNLKNDNKTAEVTYKSHAGYSFNEGWDITTANIPASVEYNSVTYSVTSIGESAFDSCTGLTSVTIGNSVTSIGDYAFYECSGLTSIEIPNSVTSIGYGAFCECSGLTSITIPNSVTSIGADAFYGCTAVTDVYCYADPNNLTWNDDYCDDFKDADHATVCHVMASALATYDENWGGTSFGDENTGVNVTFVGDLPASTPTPTAPAWLLEGDEWDDATKTLTVNSNLPVNAYQKNTVIEHVIISSGVTSIGDAAFAECSGLTSVTIPNSVTSIGNAAFYLCSGLTSITIPSSVTSIGNLAFRYCSNLETVTINAESLESYGTNAFQGTAEGLKIYVPAGSVDTYKTAWSAYADKIEAIATSTYTVTLKSGTDDATSWQGKASEGEYQALPLEGVAAGTAVTVKYSGTKKVKSVKAVKKAAAPAPAAKAAAEATAEDKGKLIGADGNIYADVAAATAAGTTAVAKIIYIGTEGHDTYKHGLALALTDEGQMAWQDAIDACSDKNTTTPVTGATWLLASKAQWNYMLGDNGAGSYTALRDGFSSVGGSNLQSDGYRSSTEADSDCAWFYYFDDGNWYDGDKGNDYLYVRACLAF